MPEERQTDAVDKFLADQKSFEDRKQTLIADLLKQKEAVLKEFDDKLAKLGYPGSNSIKSKRSHHKKAIDSGSKPKK